MSAELVGDTSGVTLCTSGSAVLVTGLNVTSGSTGDLVTAVSKASGSRYKAPFVVQSSNFIGPPVSSKETLSAITGMC